MSFKILEKNGVENEGVDGGALNNFCTGNRDGIVAGVLSECVLAAAGNGVSLSPGLLVICGVRIKITTAETFYLSAFPASPTQYQLVVQITLDNGDISAEFFLRSPENLQKNNIYAEGHGIYQAEIGSFVYNPDGSISNLIRTIDVIQGAADGGGVNIEVGDITTETLAAGLDAEFDVTVRSENKKTYLDFSAFIPRGKDGDKGDDGLEALALKYPVSEVEAVPTLGSDIYTSVSQFNRTPIVGETYVQYCVGFGNVAGRSWITTEKILSVGEGGNINVECTLVYETTASCSVDQNELIVREVLPSEVTAESPDFVEVNSRVSGVLYHKKKLGSKYRYVQLCNIFRVSLRYDDGELYYLGGEDIYADINSVNLTHTLIFVELSDNDTDDSYILPLTYFCESPNHGENDETYYTFTFEDSIKAVTIETCDCGHINSMTYHDSDIKKLRDTIGDYVTETELQDRLNSYVTETELQDSLNGYVTETEIVNIENGTTAAGNANKLGGVEASGYALKDDIIFQGYALNQDCNTFYDTGIYSIKEGENCPSGSQFGTLLVMSYRKGKGNIKTDFATQLFLPNGDDASKPNKMFYRTSLDNTWQPWQEVAVKSGIDDIINGITPVAEAKTLSLSAAVGSTNQPVYFSADGVPVACERNLDDYVTETALQESLDGYVTETALQESLGDYVTETALQESLGSYVTETELQESLDGYLPIESAATGESRTELNYDNSSFCITGRSAENVVMSKAQFNLSGLVYTLRDPIAAIDTAKLTFSKNGFTGELYNIDNDNIKSTLELSNSNGLICSLRDGALNPAKLTFSENGLTFEWAFDSLEFSPGAGGLTVNGSPVVTEDKNGLYLHQVKIKLQSEYAYGTAEVLQANSYAILVIPTRSSEPFTFSTFIDFLNERGKKDIVQEFANRAVLYYTLDILRSVTTTLNAQAGIQNFPGGGSNMLHLTFDIPKMNENNIIVYSHRDLTIWLNEENFTISDTVFDV